ncbi:MAG: MBL fold metallo-hydrolase [Planctomycetota bacterium]|nr:MBL fold metallo-hydrolase [Planctomycetota bacterium]
MPSLSLEFLGSGTSTGVPAIGCACAVCTSDDPRNRRLRPSVLLRGGGTAVVVDTGPDFREQMLRSKVARLDAVLITHYHADHVVGIDDLRRFNMLQKQVLPCWATEKTLASLRHSFGYVFSETLRPGLPNLTPQTIVPGQPFEIGELRLEPYEIDHHVLPNIALRIARKGTQGPVLVYCMDCKRIPEASYEALAGADLLVLDMLREQPHPTHFNLEEALAAVARLRPRKTWFAHMAHEVDHAAIEAKLPPGIRLAYDGLVVEP